MPLASLTLLIGVRSLRDRTILDSYRRCGRRCLSLRPNHILHFFSVISAVIYHCISWCVPPPVKACFPFLFRYIPKRCRKMSTSPELELRQLRPRRRCLKTKNDDGNVGLANLLCYDILMLVAHNCHYVDLLNLSLVSKQLRQAVFPLNEHEDLHDRRLMRYSCEGPEKSHCWTCGIQICHVS